MSSNTPNLGLLKKDPLTDGNDTFNIKMMLNDNWDKIDEAVSAIDEKVTDHSSRLDTAVFADMTFNPGLQIVNSARASRFSLGSIKGRTLINLAGRLGKADDPSKLVNYQLTSSVEPNGTRITLLSGTGSLAVRPISYKAGKKYILLSDVKNGNITSELFVQAAGGSILEMPAVIKSLDTSKFVTVVTKLAPSADISSGSLETVFTGTSGQYAWVKNMRVYEISDVEYAAIDKMTSEQLAAKYPYVDSVQPVRNPYAIRYGENLLPPFYEWNLTDTIITGPYSANLTPLSTNRVTYIDIPIVGGETYTFSAQHNANIALSFFRADGTSVNSSGYTTDQSVTVTSTNSEVFARISFSNLLKNIGTFTITNPILNIGGTARAFKPREDAILALQTDLYADTMNGGSTGDEVFVRDSQYFKVKNVAEVALDGNKITAINSVENHTGFKSVYPVIPSENYAFASLIAGVKYDGKILGNGGHTATADAWAIDSLNKNFAVSIPSTDSGWGDSYMPTVGEVKAYFLGWRMYNGDNSGTAYNGTGTKTWKPIPGFLDPLIPSVTTVPTSVSSPDWMPYRLIYKLVEPTIEPIMSEGTLTLIEGDNQVEVGTGGVIREKANPKNDGVNVYINVDSSLPNMKGYTGSELRYKTQKIINVYIDNKIDHRWRVAAIPTANGKEAVFVKLGDFDNTAAYSVTYLMQDKSPISPFRGLYAFNEKSLLQDLISVNKRISNVEAVAQQAFQSGVNVKQQVVDAANALNAGASTSNDWKTIANKLGNVSTSRGTSAQLLALLPNMGLVVGGSGRPYFDKDGYMYTAVTMPTMTIYKYDKNGTKVAEIYCGPGTNPSIYFSIQATISGYGGTLFLKDSRKALFYSYSGTLLETVTFTFDQTGVQDVLYTKERGVELVHTSGIFSQTYLRVSFAGGNSVASSSTQASFISPTTVLAFPLDFYYSEASRLQVVQYIGGKWVGDSVQAYRNLSANLAGPNIFAALAFRE